MIRSHARERLPGEGFTLLREAAPQFVEAMFGMFAQQMVNDMRSGRLRAY